LKKKRYTLYPVDGEPRRRWRWILLWSGVAVILLIMLAAGGSYLWFRSQVSSANSRITPDIIAALQEKPSTTIAGDPSQASQGTPQGTTDTTEQFTQPSPSAMNLLVLGSDRRSNEPSIGGRSDTLMIVHIDPERNFLSVLSLPRDLRVDVPGHGKGKLNTAYAFGGPALAIKTVERVTGVDINHYLEVGFDAFKDIVDSLGGVYVDVDRRYYNPLYYYEPIDLQPGYQLLNGADALDYVRFRHDRNMDFGRMERQQRFMTALREQAMGWDLPFKLPGLISALFRNVTTDLDANEILRLTTWGIRLSGDSIRTITLRGATPTIAGASYVTVTDSQLASAVDRLLNVSAAGTAPDDTTTTSSSTTSTTVYSTTTTEAVDVSGLKVNIRGASGRAGETAGAANWITSLGMTVGVSLDDTQNPVSRSAIQYPAGQLADARRVSQATGIDRIVRARVNRVTVLLGADFQLQAQFVLPPSADTVPDSEVWKEAAAGAPFAVQAPMYLPHGYSLFGKMPESAPTYNIKVGGGTKPAFKMLYPYSGNEDQVLGITETSWSDAPAASKGLTVTHDGTVFTVVRNGQQVERIWWKSDGTLFWISNTLSHLLDQDELLEIAESMISIPAR
jgi:LCP family protein required for cell wall assembly